jgi:hypothetical protein
MYASVDSKGVYMDAKPFRINVCEKRRRGMAESNTKLPANNPSVSSNAAHQSLKTKKQPR